VIWRTLAHIFKPYAIRDDDDYDLQIKRIKNDIAFENDDDAANATRIEELLRTIESKSGVLLTHISIMIAVTGFLIVSFAADGWEKIVLTVELVGYLLLALFCLRCQFHLGLGVFEERGGDGGGGVSVKYVVSRGRTRVFLGELIIRESIFRRTYSALVALTIVLVVTVSAHLFIDDLSISFAVLFQTIADGGE